MKKVISVVLIITAMLSLFVGCSQNTSTEQPSSSSGGEEPAQGKNGDKDNTITMYTNAEFAPFEYFEGEKIVGVDVDIAREIAKDLGKELVVEHIDFKSLIPALSTGKADFVAAGMTISSDREEEVDFTIPYIESIQNIIYKKGAELKSMDDLKGKKIGVQLGTTGDLSVSEAVDSEDGKLHDSGAEVKTYSNALEASQDLLTGRIDAVVIDELPAEEIVKNNEEDLGTVNFGEISEHYGIAVKQGNEELLKSMNSTLQRLIDEGKIDEFVANHKKNV